MVTLKEGAWFGDYQIMLSVKSNWELKAGRSSRKQEGSTGKLGTGKVQVFKLADEKYLELIN